MNGLLEGALSDHEVAAYGCALAAWQWGARSPVWRTAAALPHHPYDFVC